MVNGCCVPEADIPRKFGRKERGLRHSTAKTTDEYAGANGQKDAVHAIRRANRIRIVKLSFLAIAQHVVGDQYGAGHKLRLQQLVTWQIEILPMVNQDEIPRPAKMSQQLQRVADMKVYKVGQTCFLRHFAGERSLLTAETGIRFPLGVPTPHLCHTRALAQQCCKRRSRNNAAGEDLHVTTGLAAPL